MLRPTIAEIPPEEVGQEAEDQQQLKSMQQQQQRPYNVATLSSPWEYDDTKFQCHACHSDFGAINRRHHCRLCGRIFCNDCSNQRALIPPSSIVLTPQGGKKASSSTVTGNYETISFTPTEDPDRMLTYVNSGELLYGKGLEERFKLAREPLRVCKHCHDQLQPLQEELRSANANAVRYNHIDPTNIRRLFNSPLAFTLGHEIRKAAYTLNNLLPMPKRMGAVVAVAVAGNDELQFFNSHSSDLQQCREHCSALSPTLNNIDGVRIPARLLEQARGIAVLTVVKGGFGLAGVEFGTGLVVARLDGNNRWSPPSAIGTAGVSWGALVGAQVSDHVFLLMTDAAVELFFLRKNSLQLGADVGIAVGPVGRTVEADVSTLGTPIYTYSLSKGLYAGISLDGKVVVTRDRVNEKFYGRTVTGAEILGGAVPTPPAAQPLYEALTRCHVYATGHRPSSSSVVAVQQQQQLPLPRDRVLSEYGEAPEYGL